MNFCRPFVPLLLAFFSLATLAQVKTTIAIPAGTPEDQAIQAITSESDAQKRTPMLEEFVQKFSSNPAAVAYGNWQLAQNAVTAGKLEQALAYGDKALAAMPDVLDILVSQADIAQQLKNSAKVVDYAARGAAVVASVARQPKIEGLSDEDWARRLDEQKKSLQPNLDYLEVSAYNAITAEQNKQKRMQEINQFLPAFPASKFAQPVTTLAIVTLQELKDVAGLAAFGDKVLATSPNDIRLLTVLANAYADDPSGVHLAKATTYARRAIELEAKQGSSADASMKSLAGLAHSVLGYALLRENKFQPAATELRTATLMLKGSPPDLAAALYRLGFAYAKMERAADATKALTEAAEIEGPYQPLARDLLARIRAARAGAR